MREPIYDSSTESDPSIGSISLTMDTSQAEYDDEEAVQPPGKDKIRYVKKEDDALLKDMVFPKT
jgi:hypothetical protein